MRTCTQVNKAALIVEGNFRTFRKILDQFYLVRLFSFFHIFNSFFSWKSKSCNRMTFFDDFLHFCFDFVQCFTAEAFAVEVIIKSGINGRTDCQFGIRVQSFHCFCQNVGGSMTVSCFSGFVIECENAQSAVFINNGTKVNNFAIDFSCTGSSCQSFTDIFGNIINGHGLFIFFLGSVF